MTAKTWDFKNAISERLQDKELVGKIAGLIEANPRAMIQLSDLSTKSDPSNQVEFVRGLQWIITGVAEFNVSIEKKPQDFRWEPYSSAVLELEELIKSKNIDSKPINQDPGQGSGPDKSTQEDSPDLDADGEVLNEGDQLVPSFAAFSALLIGLRAQANSFGPRNNGRAIQVGQQQLQSLATEVKPILHATEG